MRFDRLSARQTAASSDPNILNQFASPTVHVHQLGRCYSEFVLHFWGCKDLLHVHCEGIVSVVG